MLRAALKEPLRQHLSRVKAQHQCDLANGRGCVTLPGALQAKYPNAEREWGWQWVFPATRFYVDRASGDRRRSPFARIRRAARRQGCGTGRWHREAGDVPYAAAFVCDASARDGL